MKIKINQMAGGLKCFAVVLARLRTIILEREAHAGWTRDELGAA